VEPLLSRPAPAMLRHGSGGFGWHGHRRQIWAWSRSLLPPPHARLYGRVAESMVLLKE
jgi:hypothetical protein